MAEHLQGAGARDWTVLLVGGSSGVGKSTLAREIARRTGAALAHADDYRMALERVLSPEQNAELHAFAHGGPEALHEEAALRAWQRIGAVMSHALEIVVAHHVFGDHPLVIEGDALLPAFASRTEFAGYAVSHGVRALYVVEPDASAIHHNVVRRGRDWHLDAEGLARYAQATWRYGTWLAAEAAARGLPVLPARPWESLADRAMAVLMGEEEAPGGVVALTA